MQDAWRAYLELALGLTEASRKRAREVANEALGRGGTTAAQVQTFVDDLVSTSRANREGLARLVRYEVDRALGAVGLATAEEVAELTARLRELERRLNQAGTDAPAGAAPAPPARPPVAKKAVAKKSVVKKAVAKKSVAKKGVAKQAVTPQAAGSKVAEKAPAKRAAAKQSAAKKAG